MFFGHLSRGRHALVVALLLAQSGMLFASAPSWAIVAESADMRGRIEIDKASIHRDHGRVRTTLRVTEPKEMPVAEGRGALMSRFSISIVEFRCASNEYRYLKTHWIPSPTSTQVLGEYVNLEDGYSVAKFPLLNALSYSCGKSQGQ